MEDKHSFQLVEIELVYSAKKRSVINRRFDTKIKFNLSKNYSSNKLSEKRSHSSKYQGMPGRKINEGKGNV